jgi:predicted nucleic acid-binding Zn ribbon protein
MTGGDWEGPRARRRRPNPIDRGPRRVKESLDAVTARLGNPDAETLSAVFVQWEEIAGASVASHVQPLRLKDGVLVVAADHPAWATQIRALSATVLQRIGEITGAAPTRLEVTVRRP